MNLLKDFPEDILVQISCAFNLFDSDKDGFLKQKDLHFVFQEFVLKFRNNSGKG